MRICRYVIQSPLAYPSRRAEHETHRGFMRRQQITQTVLLNQVHKSISLEDSREWYMREVKEQQSRGELFQDPFMPAVDSTIRKTLSPHARQYEWLRPHQLTHSPKFIIDGISRFDIRQGEIGDCWFLAALSSLSMHPNLLEQVSLCIHSSNLICIAFYLRIYQLRMLADIFHRILYS
ncbi:unnamed protein product [Echinostoma caproni]|uniref:Calpain catalytic domain-containing protein n=1 Tax=Echinostoma caproni TaxID=27848 RepID=A0A183AM70_9TREM|nr:unnamed protein product [Echinostoma caproni]